MTTADNTSDDPTMRWLRLVRLLVMVTFILSCIAALVFFRRKSPNFRSRLPALNLLLLSLTNELLITLPAIVNAPPGGDGVSEGWTLGITFCRFHTWTVRYLGQTLGVTMVTVTLHEWLMTQHILRGRLRGSVCVKVLPFILALLPWVMATFITLRVLFFTGNIGIVVGAGNGKETMMPHSNITWRPACEFDFHSVEDIVNLHTSNILLEFLVPVLISLGLLLALQTVERRDFAARLEPTPGVVPLERRPGVIGREGSEGKPDMVAILERWTTSRTLPVALLNMTHIALRGPFSLLMLILICQPTIMSTGALHSWRVLARLERALYCLLPVLWVFIQPEVPRGICRCICTVRRKLFGGGGGGGCRSGGGNNEEVMWTLTESTCATEGGVSTAGDSSHPTTASRY